jgi:hypothetical protein
MTEKQAQPRSEAYLRVLWRNFNLSRKRRGGRTVSFEIYKNMKLRGTIGKGRPVKHHVPEIIRVPKRPSTWSYRAWAEKRPVTERDIDRAWDELILSEQGRCHAALAAT